MLPWSAMLQVPADVLMGARTASRCGALAFQAGWAVALLALGRLVQSVATRRWWCRVASRGRGGARAGRGRRGGRGCGRTG